MIAYIFWLFLVDDARAGHARDPPVQDSKNGTTIPSSLETIDSHPHSISQNILFAIILLLGVLVRLSTIANNISIDREWLPALAPSSASSAPIATPYDLTHLNAVMRRIDLICKVLTPFLVSTIVSTVNSYRICIMLGGLLTVLSWVAELWCARWMYRSSSALRAPKPLINEDHEEENQTVTPQSMPRHLWHTTRTLLLDQANALTQYFSTNVWIPATALALLHLTVLAESSSLITYLLEIGFSLTLITTSRACSSIVEVGSTVLTPWAVHYFSRKRTKHEKEVEGEGDDAEAEGFLQRRDETQAQGPHIDSTVLERVGLVGILWQFVNLVCPPPLSTSNPTKSPSSHLDPRSNSPLPLLPPRLLYHCQPHPNRHFSHPPPLPLHLPRRPLVLRPHDAGAHPNPSP
jgi:solute carrier family 40 (iron-regulated transporter), member 1